MVQSSIVNCMYAISTKNPLIQLVRKWTVFTYISDSSKSHHHHTRVSKYKMVNIDPLKNMQPLRTISFSNLLNIKHHMIWNCNDLLKNSLAWKKMINQSMIYNTLEVSNKIKLFMDFLDWFSKWWCKLCWLFSKKTTPSC